MFKKIVSNLSFSPSLITQLNLYAKRNQKEKTVRYFGLIFTIFAIIIQFFLVFFPPETTNTSHPNDFIYSSALDNNFSLSDYLALYDNNYNNIKDTLTYAGITRSELAGAQYGSWKTNNKLLWGLLPKLGSDSNEIAASMINSASEDSETVYIRPLVQSQPNSIYGWTGRSDNIGWFAISEIGGNLITEIIPEQPSQPEEIVKNITAINTSQGSIDASSVSADVDNWIKYTLSIKNNGTTDAIVNFDVDLYDILEYAKLIYNDGGTFDSRSNHIYWPEVTLEPGSEQIRTFVIRVDNDIYATARGTNESMSYDCTLTSVFGNASNIRLNCPSQKIIEEISLQFPRTSSVVNIISSIILLILAIFFYARARQINKEIRIIKKDLHRGTI